MSVHSNRRRSLATAIAIAASLLLACGDGGAREHAFAGEAKGAAAAPDCREPREGCACAGNQPPVPCAPEVQQPEPGYCLQGSRRCVQGRFGACEDVRRFAAAERASLPSLLEPGVEHAPCNDCEPTCFRVSDGLDPAAGELDDPFSTGLRYHSSGAGLTLIADVPEAGSGMPPVGAPEDALYLEIAEGLTASAAHSARVRPERSDVYLLLDQSSSMAEETLWLYDAFDAGAFLPAGSTCAGGDDALLAQGMAGALRCAIPDTELGLGMFRDIPFEPYAADQALEPEPRAADARNELAYRNHARESADLASVRAAMTSLGGLESSGDPDVAGSQVPALHAIATGEGLFAGFGRASVPDAAECDGERFGYPCFRPDGEPVVVLVTDAPMHNGPDSGGDGYDYDPAALSTQTGTVPGATRVPAGNGDWTSAYTLPDDAGNTLAVYDGTTAGLPAAVPASAVGCGADELAPNAVFRFHVDAPGGGAASVPVALSTDGSSFGAAVAVFTSAVSGIESRPDASDDNELFTSALPLGDVTRRHVQIHGDTEDASGAGDMAADYQGSLFGAACGANTLAPDAVYRLDVPSAASASELAVTLDMGSDRGVLSVYEADAGPLPRWPAQADPDVVTGNSDASEARVHTIALPNDPAQAYVTVGGDTAPLGADFDASVLGGETCAPDSASMDAAFRIHVDGTRTLRFDTEGSSFDTVLSLHDAPPPTVTGNALVRTVANTNEDAATAFAAGPVDGLRQIFEGDTSAMRADVSDRFGCGMDGGCGDAVYAIEVRARTTLRVEAEPTAASAEQGFTPAVLVTRADPAGVSGRYAPLSTGAEYTCALSGGAVYCWGADEIGQLGNGGAAGDPPSFAAVQVAGVADAVQIGAGRRHACAVVQSGAVHCWGAGGSGQLGDGALVDRYTPVQVAAVSGAGTLSGMVQVECGGQHCCALRGDGAALCWGENTYGQLGIGITSPASARPVLVSGGHAFTQLAVSDDHTCAIRAGDGAVLCWGAGRNGRLGDGSTGNNLVPGPVTGVVSAAHVIAGESHNCAVLSSGRVQCWGSGTHGQLGQGNDLGEHSTPVTVRNFDGSGLLGNARGGAAGMTHTCITTLEGYVQCFGYNAQRQLGNDSTLEAPLPTGVHELLDVVHVVSSHEHSCALRADGTLMCWGQGTSGKLGSGNATTPVRPVRAQPGAPHVSFGNGSLDTAFTQACRSPLQPPEPGCTPGTSGGQRYFFCTDHARTWAGAAQTCSAVGYGLADIDASGENAFIAAQLDARAWIGAKRESSADWVDLYSNLHFANEQGARVWQTDVVGHEECVLGFFCDFVPTVGWFTPEAAPDLIDSDPYGAASTWAADDQPSPAWGHDCATLAPSGKWATDACSAVPERAGCATVTTSCLPGGPLGWAEPWIGDPARLSAETLAGPLAAPHFAGGVEHDYVCEQRASARQITLDPGRYYVTVKGADDGVGSNACSGGYRLHIEDVGSPSGGFLACDDNGAAETTASAIERTLGPGDYYLVVKGKRASDQGAYQLTVRDVDAVATQELGCDASSGAGDPARVQFTAEPGRSYYALVKGAAPIDKGAYTLTVRDETGLSTTPRLGCDADSGPAGSARLELPLSTGDYYAVIKGLGAQEAGDYQLTVGAAAPVQSVFSPPSYDDMLAALAARDIRVATVLSCANGGACDDAQGQAQQLAADTGGVVRMAASAADVPAQVVAAVQQVEALDSVRGELLFAPDENPGFTFPAVQAVPDPGSLCSPGGEPASLSACLPGATPSFRVSLTNPALAPVPPAASGAYEFTLRITGERDGEVRMTQDVPVLVAPTGGVPPGSYDRGSYYQDFGARGCTSANQRPSWDELLFDLDVRPDTRVTFYACSATDDRDLAGCANGTSSSGYRRVATISAGSGAGTQCTVATQADDCPTGYCSPYTHVCNELEGASCTSDNDCPGTAEGRCRPGPSSTELGNTCVIDDVTASPASALRDDNYRPFLRVRIDLESQGDRSRTPSVFFWEAIYRCRNLE